MASGRQGFHLAADIDEQGGDIDGVFQRRR